MMWSLLCLGPHLRKCSLLSVVLINSSYQLGSCLIRKANIELKWDLSALWSAFSHASSVSKDRFSSTRAFSRPLYFMRSSQPGFSFQFHSILQETRKYRCPSCLPFSRAVQELPYFSSWCKKRIEPFSSLQIILQNFSQHPNFGRSTFSDFTN